LLGETSVGDLPFDLRGVHALEIRNEKDRDNVSKLVKAITERIGPRKYNNSESIESSSRYNIYSYFLTLTVAVALAISWYRFDDQSSTGTIAMLEKIETLEEIQSRGYLRCGIGGSDSIFGSVNFSSTRSDLNFDYYDDATGFEPDFCRVIAIGIFGSYKERVVFKEMTLLDRFPAVENSEVDVVFASTTWNSARDTMGNISFGPVIYHDGLKFLVRKTAGILTLPDLHKKRICMFESTATTINTKNILHNLEIVFTPVYSDVDGRPFHSFPSMMDASSRHDLCDAYAADESYLLPFLTPIGRSEEFLLIPDQPLTEEPLAPLVSKSDSEWLDIVKYAIWVTITAEKREYTQHDVDEGFAAETWKNMGLPTSHPRKIIQQIGNYGEIYNRHFGEIRPKRGRNQIQGVNGDGWITSPPIW